MAAAKIYSSPVPAVQIPNCSIFTHLFSNPDPTFVGPHSGSLPAFIDATTGTTLSRQQLKQLALSFAYGILHYPGVPLKRGDTVLIYSPNSLAWPVILFGTIAAGLRATLANSAYTASELTHQFHDSGAKLVLTFEDGLSVVEEMYKGLSFSSTEADNRTIVINSSLKWAGGPDTTSSSARNGLTRMDELLKQGTLTEEARFDGDLAHETAILCYSSGTTGKPKGVETTHKNITALVQIVSGLFHLNNEDCMLGILPFYHIYGAAKLLHFPFSRGASVVIQTRFEPVQFCQNIEKYRITHALIVPPVLVIMARHPAVAQYNLDTLRILFSGAAPLGDVLVKDVTARLRSYRKNSPNARTIEILQGYGLTETSPTTHLLPDGDSIRKVGSIGLLLPNLQARLVLDSESSKDIDADEGKPGELWIRGPTVMKGYLNNPNATQNSITPDGWFKTGDIGIRDKDGYYYIVDRKKELIKYKGFQVPPAELESILLGHPDIADTAVIGVSDVEAATELPRAYVVHAHPENVGSPSEKEAFGKAVVKWIEGKVANHKRLRGGVVVIDIIPKSAAGKILRRELRDRAKQELAAVNVKAKL